MQVEGQKMELFPEVPTQMFLTEEGVQVPQVMYGQLAGGKGV